MTLNYTIRCPPISGCYQPSILRYFTTPDLILYSSCSSLAFHLSLSMFRILFLYIITYFQTDLLVGGWGGFKFNYMDVWRRDVLRAHTIATDGRPGVDGGGGGGVG